MNTGLRIVPQPTVIDPERWDNIQNVWNEAYNLQGKFELACFGAMFCVLGAVGTGIAYAVTAGTGLAIAALVCAVAATALFGYGYSCKFKSDKAKIEKFELEYPQWINVFPERLYKNIQIIIEEGKKIHNQFDSLDILTKSELFLILGLLDPTNIKLGQFHLDNPNPLLLVRIYAETAQLENVTRSAFPVIYDDRSTYCFNALKQRFNTTSRLHPVIQPVITWFENNKDKFDEIIYQLYLKKENYDGVRKYFFD